VPFSLVAYTESQDSSGALVNVAALADQHITTQGDDVVVPDWANKLAGVCAIGATISQAQMTSPSMRAESLLDVAPVSVGAEPVFPLAYVDLWDKPRTLEPGEGLQALVAETAAGAEQETVLAWLQGDVAAAPDGVVETIRCTATATLTALAWSLATLVLSQSLRAGRYAIVGMRAQSAGLLAARLVIPGSQFRPGVIGTDAAGDQPPMKFRRGDMGQSWGEFEHRFVPQVEFLSVSADTAETVWLDVVKVA
jgi:hypothetical protein